MSTACDPSLVPEGSPGVAELLVPGPLTAADAVALMGPKRAGFHNWLLQLGWRGVHWPAVIWLVGLHIGALLAPFYFTWMGLGVAFGLAWLTGGVGICLGYHRLLTHSSFTTFRPIRWTIAWLGGLAGQGPAITWVAMHRKHHVYSDQEGDPHSPRDGAWWSHMLWLVPNLSSPRLNALLKRYAPDLLRDPVLRVLDKTFLVWYFVLGIALFLVGWLGWDVRTGCSFVVWGMFVRLVYVLHITWLVNSATHMWGYRNYETTDDSRNLWWVGLLSFGEGWHNNHHAYQKLARHGHRWWEFDVTYLSICLMERLGLAWNVARDIPTQYRKRRQSRRETASRAVA